MKNEDSIVLLKNYKTHGTNCTCTWYCEVKARTLFRQCSRVKYGQA